LCSVIFLLLIAIGVRFSTRTIKGMLLSSSLFVIIGALGADSWRDYFFASRQLLFAVPSLSILAAIGLENTLLRRRLMGAFIAALFLAATLTTDVRMQLNAKENWPAAAAALAQVSRNGYCVQMAGGERGQLMLYSVFVPSLLTRSCDLPGQSKVALVSNLETQARMLSTSQEELRALGFARKKTIAVGGTTIEMEDR